MTYRAPPPDAPLLIVAGQVVALDRNTGKLLWRYNLKGVARRFAFDVERVFVLESTGTFHCLELATGRLIGAVETGLGAANSMLIDGDRIYLAGDDYAAAMDFSGVILWRESIPSNGSHSLCGLGIAGGNIMQPDFSKA
jgi:outer membrane protein assembly factor BamB